MKFGVTELNGVFFFQIANTVIFVMVLLGVPYYLFMKYNKLSKIENRLASIETEIKKMTSGKDV